MARLDADIKKWNDVIDKAGIREEVSRKVGRNASKKLSIAVVGAGMGGLAVAATLRQRRHRRRRSTSRPRASRRIGAGIQMMPNSMKVLRGIGIEERLREIVVRALFASQPRSATPAR